MLSFPLEFSFIFVSFNSRMLHWRCAKQLYHRLRFSRPQESEKKIPNQECRMSRCDAQQLFQRLLCTPLYTQFVFVFSFSILTDLLPDSVRHDLCDSFCRLGHFLLSKTKRIVTKAVVMSIHRNSYIISTLHYYIIICTKPNWLV